MSNQYFLFESERKTETDLCNKVLYSILIHKIVNKYE